MIRFATALVLVSLLGGAALAQQTTSSGQPAGTATAPAPEADEADDDPMKIICRRVRPPTGTRVAGPGTRQQMCMSKADWEQQELDAQEALKVRDSGVCAPRECSG